MNPGFGYETNFPSSSGGGTSFLMNFIPVFIFIMIIITIGIIIYRLFYKGASAAYHQKASSKEKNSRPYQTDINLKIDRTNRQKIGYPDDFETFDNHCLLVKETDGVLHFNYDNSPQIQLVDVEFTPRYGYHTAGNDDHFGTSTPYEIPSDGILTFRDLSGQNQFLIKAQLEQSLYIRLKTEFLTFT
ncbi:hypothetical protein [Holzapfeliella sp. JNUCC 72]